MNGAIQAARQIDDPGARPNPTKPIITPREPPPLATALWRGARGRCPVCGEGKLFAGYLKLAEACTVCGTRLGHVRADDAPPYFVIFLVGHLLVPPVFWVERAYEPPMWLHMVVWLPLFTLICVLLLRPIKGATAAWMLRMGMGDPETRPEQNRD